MDISIKRITTVIYLTDGYEGTNMNTSVIHGETIQQLREDLKNIEKVK